MNLIKTIFGTKNDRDIKRLQPLVERINELEKSYQALSEEQLLSKTQAFKERVAGGESLDDILCEAFATVKNACRRLCGTSREVCGHELTWDMVPFDVQLIGGIVLHQGKISEMQTGEGKTLVATLPLYLNALSGQNVRLVTVNDYLARRDAQWMGHLLGYLGLTIGCIQNQMSPAERRAQYACDVTYGTNSEFGFDYLRDNGMASDPSQVVQRGHYFAIIDEVDSILIDEARTPLIIAGPAMHTSTAQYAELKPRIERLVRDQNEICNRFVADAKTALEAGDTDTAMRKLYQIYHGMPKHKQFQHLIEDVAVRKLHEQIESMMMTDMRKEDARDLREALLFAIDERTREVSLTDRGNEKLSPSDPEMFVMPDLVSALSALDGDASLTAEDRTKKRQQIQADFMVRSERVHNVDQLLRAYSLYEKDVDYVVQDNHVHIVDEFTGRIMLGRRWSDGLHQAVEAKEGVEIERETQTLATITIQNYFRLYKKLAGMTGTAETEASEFHDIYKLDVVTIPTNRPIRRVDSNDFIYKTQREKFRAIIEEVEKRHQRGQPVLLGTATVETSEVISRMLRMAKIPHNVLNAKNHAREAEIVTLAGQPGAVTIATNMAGRGTDIKLGENVVWVPESTIKSQVKLEDKYDNGRKTLRELLEEKPCGLHVIGSERHESRRIDRQLRGRCARQGDPGSSQFYISLEDQLMRLFGSDRISGIMTRLGMQEGEALEHKWLNRSVETAQRRVEQQNFAARKRTLEYDDVMNKQRTVVYDLRRDVLMSEGAHGHILDVFNDLILSQCEKYLTSPKDAEPGELVAWVAETFPVALLANEIEPFRGEPGKASELIYDRVSEAYELKCSMEEPQVLPVMERSVFLSCIDQQWQDYLRAMDELRHGVNLRAYGQRDPLVEYKREAFGMFEELMTNIKTEVATSVFRATTLQNYQRMMAIPQSRIQTVHTDMNMLAGGMPQGDDSEGGVSARRPLSAEVPQSAVDGFDAMIQAMEQRASGAPAQQRSEPVVKTASVGRNDPCPCGSGKKYKKCCGQGL
ncbi:MAG: preprotein translocase subunit SecA [Verrucomicrobiota bacterium]|jgi:preprotein translocase subunit SecA|nr:preprotein translocase subunit SecA [Verrucomicrobiota bacterium]